MKITFHKDAEIEFNQSIDYYLKISPELGLDFALEVNESIKRISANPSAWTIVMGDIRRSLVSRFPYGVLYSIQDDDVYIIAVMNLHRKPNYWEERID